MNIAGVMAAATLAVGVPLNARVAWRLWSLARATPSNVVLRDRAIVATAVLLFVIVFGLIFVNNDLATPVVSFSDTKLITRSVALIVAIVPASYWLWAYG